MEKKFKVEVGNHTDFTNTLASAKEIANGYIRWWFEDLGGMGTPVYTITDLTTGLVVSRG